MKFIAIFLLAISCASQSSKKNLEQNTSQSNGTKVNKYNYLQDFYKIRGELYKKSKTCKQYSNKNLRQVLTPTEKSHGTQGQKFKNSRQISQYLKNYDPTQFDWYLSAKLKTLYLSYPKLEKIAQEHFEISNSIRDCSNEFDNLSFLHSAIEVWSDPKSSKSNKFLVMQVFQRYFDYISAQEVSLLNVLVTNSLLQKLEQKKLIRFKNKDLYLTDSGELELLYTKTGQEILKLFQDKRYLDIYDQDKLLREAKITFTKKMMQSFTYL